MVLKGSNLLFVLVLLLSLVACGSDQSDDTGNTTDAIAKDYTGKKIVFVNSYHRGYEWSDAISEGIMTTLEGTGVSLKIIYLNTTSDPSEQFAENVTLSAKAEIAVFAPDVIIACDDNAQKYLIVPEYLGGNIPVVFCAVNWDASVYGYPAANVTGMIEVDLIKQLYEILKPFKHGDRLALLSDNSASSRSNATAWLEIFPDMTTYLTNDYAEFKQAYLDLQAETDLLFIADNASVTDWDEADAREFFVENARIPTAGVNEWMSPYVLMVLGKVGQEQGIWAAQTALQIIDGTPVTDIEIVANSEGVMIVNLDIAGQLDISLPVNLLRNAEIVGSKAPTGE